MVETKGKMAVICHGDLWWSNVLFKYDPDTGSPVEVKFIDFQSSRVASLGKGAGSQSKGISKNIKSENQTFCKIRDSCIWINLISVLPQIQDLRSQKTLTTSLRLDFLGLKYFMMVDNKYFFNFIQDQKNLI